MSLLYRGIAIAVIFFITTLAWISLGGTMQTRTWMSKSKLHSEVSRLWGQEHQQYAPQFQEKQTVKISRGKEQIIINPLQPVKTNITVHLDLAHRKKGLQWYNTYKVAFAGHYFLKNPSSRESRDILVSFSFTHCLLEQFVP